jgi:hypothetical protein
MSSTLEERLKNNSSAFDGLLSLIPAKYYYDEDTQDQWKAKKQTKEEARQIKRAKLDPSQIENSDKISSASQVLSKKAKTAKTVVVPGQKKPVQKEEQREASESEEESQKPKQNGKLSKAKAPEPKVQKNEEEDEEEEEINFFFDDEGNEVQLNQEKETEPQVPQKKAKSPPLSEAEKQKKQDSINQLKDKLAAKINILKEKRKAPGSKVAGAPSSRETVLAERRKKAELKAEQKAERKRKFAEMEKDEGEDEEDDDIEDSDDSDVEKDDGLSADNVLYQNIQFDDQTKTTSDLSNLRRAVKKKGPANKDIKGHLKILEAKKEKQALMDPEQQKELAEKEQWNRTFAQAEGVKIRDDEKLLKKALKRKEAQKRKSEVQWQERKDHVKTMISTKQKRREENLQIRKDNKGVKRKNQQKQKRKFKTSISQKRAGFEGKMKRK